MRRVLGLDLGTKTCGVAVSDSLGIPHAREEFRFPDKAYKRCMEHVLELAHKEGITLIALGYPLNMDGTAGESAHRSERFKEELLKADPSLEVVLVDERLSTVEADDALFEANLRSRKRKKVIDQQSAVIILERYLDSLEASGHGGDNR